MAVVLDITRLHLAGYAHQPKPLTPMSPLFLLSGSLGFVGPGNTTCSGDDFLCWPRAQVNLLHTVANVSGCTVLLVGDYHYSDLKVIEPGAGHAYAKTLQTHKLSKPVYQVGTLLS